MGDAQTLCDRILLIDKGTRLLYGTVDRCATPSATAPCRSAARTSPTHADGARQRHRRPRGRRRRALPHPRRRHAPGPLPRAGRERCPRRAVRGRRRPASTRSSSAPSPAIRAPRPCDERRQVAAGPAACASRAWWRDASTCARCAGAATSSGRCCCRSASPRSWPSRCSSPPSGFEDDGAGQRHHRHRQRLRRAHHRVPDRARPACSTLDEADAAAQLEAGDIGEYYVVPERLPRRTARSRASRPTRA